MWWGWHPSSHDAHRQTSRDGILSSIYVLQCIHPGDKLDTARWAIMRPSWETTRMRNRMKEHRYSTISALRVILDETEQMIHTNPLLLPLFQHAWWCAVHGVCCLLDTYANDAPTVTALQDIVGHIQRILVQPDDGPQPYPRSNLPFLSIVFPRATLAGEVTVVF